MPEQDPIRRAARDVQVVRDHARTWPDNLFVYPVISRRARGLSVGINLNPDKRCNFGCVYCEVNRRIPVPPGPVRVELDRLAAELGAMLDVVVSGAIWDDPYFRQVPEELRRLNDVAFSGDGEPTSRKEFPAAVRIVADALTARGLSEGKIVVITNATRLQDEPFVAALPVLQAHKGEVWAKLDAGTEEHYRLINASAVPFDRVLSNIEWLAQRMPVTIQTMLIRIGGIAATESEIDAYIDRLRHILAGGGRIAQVQLYTIARPPAQAIAEPLTDDELDGYAARIRRDLSDVPVQTFYGADVSPQEPGA
jgi:wyosine [tRNA(Phe)-imidazoG37] synthetase (radical SAM superfamily)